MDLRIDSQTIEALKEKHGADLHVLEHDGAQVIVKRPQKEIYRRFKSKAMNERTKEDAAERLIFDCLAWPEPAAAAIMFEKRYGLIDTFASKLVDLAGAAKECEATPL